MAEIHHAKGANERDRNSDAGNQCGADIAQEHEDDQDDEENGNDQGALDVFDGGTNGLGAVQHDLDVDGGGDGGFESRNGVTNAVDGFNDICAGLAINDDEDGRLAVDEARGTKILGGVLNVRDIGEFDRRAIVIADDEGHVVGGFEELVVGGDVGSGVVVGDLALG